MPRRFAVLFAFLILVIALLSATVWLLLEERREAGPEIEEKAPLAPTEPPKPEAVFEPVTFSALPGWEKDVLSEALPALRSSCSVLVRRPADAPVGPAGVGGRAEDWRSLCAALDEPEAADAGTLREILERELRPWAVTNRGVEREGLFTGYYEPRLHGSRRRHGPYQTPLYREPGDLVEVDLGAFREDLEGRRIAGRFIRRPGGRDRLVPYHDRRAIEGGALSDRDLELVWVDDPVDAFFLQVQGSGRVALEDGTVLRVGYAGQNGHPYTAIGRELVERGEMALEEVSLRSIRRWLETHPESAPEVMAANASYVFFRVLGEVRGGEGDPSGPLGSLGVPLTPGRSVAVDDRFLPLGAPVWLAGAMPQVPAEEDRASLPDLSGVDDGSLPIGERPLRRLLVAQDTGGAIRGPVRGDVFWGAGGEARAVAGHMKHRGALWLLLPRDVDPVND